MVEVRHLRALLVAVLALMAIASPAGAAPLAFSAPDRLPYGDPKGMPFLRGGEPSIAFDPAGGGHAYVVAPQGVPALIGGLLGGSSTGVAFWASADGGQTWPVAKLTGVGTGGGDSDVEVGTDHTIYVADLEAVASAICISKDFGATFPNCGSLTTLNQEGPDNDREWLTRGRGGELYLTYHDFVGGYPLIFRSDDGGRSFQSCGTIIDPSGPAAGQYSPTGGTLVSKPVVDDQGGLYVEFATPDLISAPVGAALNHLYMAVAPKGCSGNTTFANYPVYEHEGASLARIFQAQAIDGGNRLYVLAAGTKDAQDAGSNVYLFTSEDRGRTWSAPTRVNPPNLKANVFPTLTGGLGDGEAFLGWFGTETSDDPNGLKDQWRFYGAVTYDGGATFDTATVTPDVIHYGDICTQGILCGLIPGEPGNRNLADFASAATDPQTGCVALAIPGDPYNRPDLENGEDNGDSSAFVSRQTGGGCLTRANADKPASVVNGATTGCVDKATPTVTGVRARRLRGRRLRISGRAQDRGCLRGGRGRVARVRVAIARRAGSRCRYVRRSGSVGPPETCARPRFLAARGRERWSLTVRRALPRGRYAVWARAVDGERNAGAVVRLGRVTIR